MIQHFFGGGVYAKETKFPAGLGLIQHVHKFDHLAILAQGSVELVVDDVKTVIQAPACIKIVAGKHHGVKALTDVVWYCVHATEEVDADKIDEVLIGTEDMPEAMRCAKLIEGV